MPQKLKKAVAPAATPELIRLNKWISNAGLCARRAADNLIQAGKITVNGEVVTTLGYKVKPQDVVQYEGQMLQSSKPVYLILNKPKDYITTLHDPEGRKTVLELVKKACPERIYPIGRLDRNTTGLLLLTNDGTLAKMLAHPASNVKKLYQVILDKPLTKVHFEQIKAGLQLEDGIATVDKIEIVNQEPHNIGLEIHMGRNRIVRRIFEHLGYQVIKLDRVMYAHLTKKDLPRGKWRFLTPREIEQLKRFGSNK